MTRIQIRTESIYYTRTNDQASTTILFIHGSGGNHKSWPDGLRSLRKIGVVLMDLPGHGLSSGSGRSTVDEYVDFIDDFVSAMGLTRVIVAGHSLGGAIA
ncbi:MAG: alpha/beta fold hydrolase, partial [Thermodesulfobacteriota bacterium]|nr:alpha/beta fold hydrolase [Thermodesulfobacteriota bacterium]